MISLISDECLSRMNKVLGTSYSKDKVKKNITVSRKQKGFKFWDRLMKTKPRFDRGNN